MKGVAVILIFFTAMIIGGVVHRSYHHAVQAHQAAARVASEPAEVALQADLARRRAYAAEHPEQFVHEPVLAEAPAPVVGPPAAPITVPGAVALPAMTLRQYYAGLALQGLLAHEGACVTDMTKAAQAQRAIDAAQAQRAIDAADHLLQEAP